MKHDKKIFAPGIVIESVVTNSEAANPHVFWGSSKFKYVQMDFDGHFFWDAFASISKTFIFALVLDPIYQL